MAEDEKKISQDKATDEVAQNQGKKVMSDTAARRAASAQPQENPGTGLRDSASAASQAAAKRRAQAIKKKNKKPVSKGVWIVIAIVTFVVGILLGKFCFGFVPLGTMTGRTTITETQLDNVVATYTSSSGTHGVTAREVLDNTVGLESAQTDDGYSYPSADNVLEYVRNCILADLAEKEGVQASDEDMDAYAQKTLDSTDYDSIAAQYGMSVDKVKDLVRQAAEVENLYNQIVGEDAIGDAPEEPAETSDSKKDTPTAEYGQYIINLLGDEWDSENNTWAKQDGTFYSDLKDETFSADSATYNQAEKAYKAAYKKYQQSAQDASTKWSDYVNGAMANSALVLGELIS